MHKSSQLIEFKEPTYKKCAIVWHNQLLKTLSIKRRLFWKNPESCWSTNWKSSEHNMLTDLIRSVRRNVTGGPPSTAQNSIVSVLSCKRVHGYSGNACTKKKEICKSIKVTVSNILPVVLWRRGDLVSGTFEPPPLWSAAHLLVSFPLFPSCTMKSFKFWNGNHSKKHWWQSDHSLFIKFRAHDR